MVQILGFRTFTALRVERSGLREVPPQRLADCWSPRLFGVCSPPKSNTGGCLRAKRLPAGSLVELAWPMPAA